MPRKNHSKRIESNKEYRVFIDKLTGRITERKLNNSYEPPKEDLTYNQDVV